MQNLGERELNPLENILDRIDPRITYISALPPPAGMTTTIQGFSRERLHLNWIWRSMLDLPSTIYEPAGPASMTIGLRACGVASWRHLPLRIDRLIRMRVHELNPIWIVFSADPIAARLVGEWSRRQTVRPLHVSTQNVPGAIPPAQLNLDRLRCHCLDLADANESALGGLRPLLERWTKRERLALPFPFLGHQSVEPNQACLRANGMRGSSFVEHWQGASDAEYEDAIARSFNAVMDLHAMTPVPVAVRLMPPRPTMWLVAPSWLPNLRRRLVDRAETPRDRAGASDFANRIERQRSLVVTGDSKVLERFEASELAQNLQVVRRAEHGLFTDALGWSIAGTASAAWRMKPLINRVKGQVNQFAVNIRADAGTPAAKIVRLFEALQAKMLEAVGERAVKAICETDWGVRIVSDVPVEWLPVGALPLGLHCNVSRLTATPADLLLRQLETHEMLRLGIDDFSEILIVSAFKDGEKEDVIARVLATTFDFKRIQLRFIRVESEAEFIDAVNAYEGPLMIFDGHGHHPAGGQAYLEVGTEKIRLEALEGDIRIPPIVILSACDTHAAARPTDTVANAMLHLGARTVLATNLPVRFDDSAIMIGDILRTIDAYLPLMPSDLGRVVRWSEFIGALLRAHFIMAIAAQIIASGKSDETTMSDLVVPALLAARFKTGGEALRLLETAVLENKILDCEAFASTVRKVVAASDSIRYIQLGNPETILIGTAENLPDDLQATFANHGRLKPVWKLGDDAPPNAVDVMEVLGQIPYGKWREDRKIS